MYVKNVSYERLQAVKENTKDIVEFLPQEVKEVSDVDGKWFKERYGNAIIVEVVEVVKEPEVVEEAEDVEEVKDVKCKVCGKVCRTPAGLKIHMKSHS